MDFTDTFDARLEVLHASTQCPASEIDAAVVIFERLKTSQAICRSLITEPIHHDAVLAVFAQLCAEARSGHGSRVDE